MEENEMKKKAYIAPACSVTDFLIDSQLLAGSGVPNSGQGDDGGVGAPSMFMDDDMDNDCEDESQSFGSQCGW